MASTSLTESVPEIHVPSANASTEYIKFACQYNYNNSTIFHNSSGNDNSIELLIFRRPIVPCLFPAHDVNDFYCYLQDNGEDNKDNVHCQYEVGEKTEAMLYMGEYEDLGYLVPEGYYGLVLPEKSVSCFRSNDLQSVSEPNIKLGGSYIEKTYHQYNAWMIAVCLCAMALTWPISYLNGSNNEKIFYGDRLSLTNILLVNMTLSCISNISKAPCTALFSHAIGSDDFAERFKFVGALFLLIFYFFFKTGFLYLIIEEISFSLVILGAPAISLLFEVIHYLELLPDGINFYVYTLPVSSFLMTPSVLQDSDSPISIGLTILKFINGCLAIAFILTLAYSIYDLRYSRELEALILQVTLAIWFIGYLVIEILLFSIYNNQLDKLNGSLIYIFYWVWAPISIAFGFIVALACDLSTQFKECLQAADNWFRSLFDVSEDIELGVLPNTFG